MAWTTMHYAVGMGCAGLGAGAMCVIFRRGLRWLPLAMTAGGVWALVPDMPRVFREDFPSLGLAHSLGDKTLERSLHSIGDLFFFHQSLDAQPKQYALHGLVIILVLYNLSLLMLMWLERRQRRLQPDRAWANHAEFVGKPYPHRRRRESDSDEGASNGETEHATAYPIHASRRTGTGRHRSRVRRTG